MPKDSLSFGPCHHLIPTDAEDAAAYHLAFSCLFLLNVKNTQFFYCHVYFRYHECNVPNTSSTAQGYKKKEINEEKIGQDTQNVKILISLQFLQEITPMSNVILDWMTVTPRPKSNKCLSIILLHPAIKNGNGPTNFIIYRWIFIIANDRNKVKLSHQWEDKTQ